MKSTHALIVLSLILSLIGCANHQIRTNPEPQNVIITVKAAEPTQLSIIDSDDKINKSMEIPNNEGRLSQLSFISKNKAFIKIFSGLSVADVTRLWNDICYLENNTSIKKIELFINSPGGDAFSGLALADQIQRARRQGFIITAHASGIVASAAVPVFAVCSKRLAAPGTVFMVHEAALWKWPGRETASDIRSQNELMNLLGDRYRTVLAKYSKLKKKQWAEMEGKTTWFCTQEAILFGIVDEIE